MSKTFDQQRLMLSEEELLDHELTRPNEAYRSFFVIEPITHNGVTRVALTARDEAMNILWGSMVCEGHLPPGDPTPVALYSAMRTLIRRHLDDPNPRHEITDDPYASIEYCTAEIGRLIEAAKSRTLDVKKKSSMTDERAELVADILWDSLRQLSHAMRAVGIQGGSTEER
jgi:NTP pyrophosphatase (non-canonical NTP hydrolase)